MINLTNKEHVAKLAKAIDYSFSQGYVERERRNTLVRIYSDNADTSLPFSINASSTGYLGQTEDAAAYLPLFMQYVRGHVLTLGFTLPKWSVTARQTAGRGFDARIENLLNYYFDILGGAELTRQWALDSAFGDCFAKIVAGPAPLGITAPVVPRVYRVDPNRFIRDRSAQRLDESTFYGDLYLVGFDEARNYEGFDPEVAETLTPYRIESDDTRSIYYTRSTDSYAEEVVRLLDVYIPATGQLATYNAPTDTFLGVTDKPLRVVDMPINPYTACRLQVLPDSMFELSRLGYFRNLNSLANDLFAKAARQARLSKRNPIDMLGNENELNSLLNAPDNEAVFLQEGAKPDLYVLPGPDPSILNLGGSAAQLFSQYAGNLEVAMGISPGSKTARQSQAMLSQISAVSAFDRSIFEKFLSEIGMKLASLAFQSEALEVSFQQALPGTGYVYDEYWGPPEKLPRVGEISSYNFDVVQYSTAYRSPQERLQQLNEASGAVMQWMQAAAQGAPINLKVIMESYKKAYDLVPELEEWWSGEPPTPVQQTQQQYQSQMEHQAGGSTVNYEGAEEEGGLGELAQLGLAATGEALGAGGLQG